MVVGAWLILVIGIGLVAELLILAYGLAADRIRGNPVRQRRRSLRLSFGLTAFLLVLVLIWALAILPWIEDGL